MVEASEGLWRLPEPVVVVCAYCDRMRDATGEWQVTDRDLLFGSPDVLVSHGCCPDCLDRELARCHRTALPE